MCRFVAILLLLAGTVNAQTLIVVTQNYNDLLGPDLTTVQGSIRLTAWINDGADPLNVTQGFVRARLNVIDSTGFTQQQVNAITTNDAGQLRWTFTASPVGTLRLRSSAEFIDNTSIEILDRNLIVTSAPSTGASIVVNDPTMYVAQDYTGTPNSVAIRSADGTLSTSLVTGAHTDIFVPGSGGSGDLVVSNVVPGDIGSWDSGTGTLGIDTNNNLRSGSASINGHPLENDAEINLTLQELFAQSTNSEGVAVVTGALEIVNNDDSYPFAPILRLRDQQGHGSGLSIISEVLGDSPGIVLQGTNTYMVMQVVRISPTEQRFLSSFGIEQYFVKTTAWTDDVHRVNGSLFGDVKFTAGAGITISTNVAGFDGELQISSTGGSSETSEYFFVYDFSTSSVSQVAFSVPLDGRNLMIETCISTTNVSSGTGCELIINSASNAAWGYLIQYFSPTAWSLNSTYTNVAAFGGWVGEYPLVGNNELVICEYAKTGTTKRVSLVTGGRNVISSNPIIGFGASQSTNLFAAVTSVLFRTASGATIVSGTLKARVTK